MPLRLHPPKVVIGALVRVPKRILASVEATKRALTLRNEKFWAMKDKGYDTEGVPEQFIMYREDEHYLYVPRNFSPVYGRDISRQHYQVQNTVQFGDPAVVVGEDKIVLGPNEWQSWDQRPAFEALVSGPKWPFGKILALRPGAGKTVIALKGAHFRGGPVLWVTMSTGLMEQTKAAITKFLGIPPKQIGHVQGARNKWQGYPITMAMLHTLAWKEHPPEFWNHWRLAIFDEGDVLAANTFIPVAPKLNCERWLLTGTPKRDDKMEKLFELHFGPVCYEYMEYALEPECYFVDTNASPDLVCEVGWDPWRQKRRVHFAMTVRKLLKDADRLAQLIDMVNKATKNGRTCLVIGDSVEGLIHARAECMARLPHLTQGLVVGQVGQKARMKILEENQVVWGTTKLTYRGLDRPAFDTLIVATMIAAKTSVWVQSTGRVLREKAGKEKPLVIVLVDRNIEPLAMMAAKLALLFKKKKWQVKGAERILSEFKERSRAYRQMEAQ